LWPLELRVKPTDQVGSRSKRRNPLTFCRRQHRAAEHDLPARVTLAFDATRPRDKPFSFSAQPREAFIDQAKARACFF
jgi:hypothetical protein